MNFSYQGRDPPRNLQAMLTSANISPENPWFMDSGANQHLTADATNFDATTSCIMLVMII